MRIRDVQVGDIVIPRVWPKREVRLLGGGYLEWSDTHIQFVGARLPVIRVDTDGSVSLQLPGTDCYRWWPIEYCDPINPPNLNSSEQQAALDSASESLALALRNQRQLETDLTKERRAVADLRQQVSDLTVQNNALRADLQKVGKQTQNGSRFALLELD